ncbi:MAG: hypothetical protein ABSB01_24060 [Streptosporangiaceae bacterium]|jgi:hypothetical protein
MRIRLTALASGLIGAGVIALAVPLSGSAQAATLPYAPAAASATHASSGVARTDAPNYTANVTLTVRCGKFVGKINHGGTGGILNRAYLQVEGKLSSSCNSTTYLQVRYDTGITTVPEQTIGHAGARHTVDVDWETHSIEGTYGHIGARVGTTDGMPKGKIHWGAWRDV